MGAINLGEGMNKEEALMAEIKRIKQKNRNLTAEIRTMKRETESGNLLLDVNRDPQFREDLAHVIFQVDRGDITDKVLVDPVRGRIYHTHSWAPKEVQWRLVPPTDLIDPDLDVVNSDLDLIKASILNQVTIEVYNL